jgi:hypothetical protein
MSSKEYQDSRRKYNRHRVRRAVRSLIGGKRQNTTLEREKDGRYFGHVWIDKQTHEAVSFLARVNGRTKKQLVHEALQAGLSRLLGEAIMEANKRAASQAEGGVPPKRMPFMREIERMAKQKGLDVGGIL